MQIAGLSQVHGDNRLTTLNPSHCMSLRIDYYRVYERRVGAADASSYTHVLVSASRPNSYFFCSYNL
jgi:hypothetical protein